MGARRRSVLSSQPLCLLCPFSGLLALPGARGLLALFVLSAPPASRQLYLSPAGCAVQARLFLFFVRTCSLVSLETEWLRPGGYVELKA